MSIEKEAIKYPPPHNIKDFDFIQNVAFRQYFVTQSHHRQKYAAKYHSSKQSKRNYPY